ncbi:MAG TPA: hypothetical protein VHB77_12270 [Planctomycetaceae bacterium]|nr:hypothetical protein [Planctomycetaceae bacterium]
MHQILDADPTEADRTYVRALGDAIDVFDEFCDERCDKMPPGVMIRYQLEVVKRIAVEDAARECGIAYLDELMNARRAFAARDVEVLSNYFGIEAEQFTK